MQIFTKTGGLWGLVVNAEGVHASNENIKAVIEAPHPHNVKELHSFLGMMNYYHKFFPNFSIILKALSNLLQLKPDGIGMHSVLKLLKLLKSFSQSHQFFYIMTPPYQ